MKILNVTYSDDGGGAAIAAHRLLAAQRAIGLDARMLVIRKLTDDGAVFVPLGRLGAWKIRAARFIAKRIGRAAAIDSPETMRTLAFVETGVGRAIAREKADIIHLHWLGAEMMSLAEMAALPSPTVWTCHDMWAFCGAEHYSTASRFIDGYASSVLADVDAWVFRRKRLAWATWQPHLVCPSGWISEQAGASALMQNAKRVVIPNAVDTSAFRPINKDEARSSLKLPIAGHVILFGAEGGRRDPRKGFDLLDEALGRLPISDASDVLLATFGSGESGVTCGRGRLSREFGVVRNPHHLALLYSAADVFVAPSRQDNLPNTVLEAQACGLPCVAFDIGGMRDIISSPLHGELVKPFDVDALGAQMIAVCKDSNSERREAIRKDAVRRFGSETIALKHLELYEQLKAERHHDGP